jgi:cell wall-associated NlpC family hydrolase
LSRRDPRTTPVRDDLASANLEGLVRAGHYVEPVTARVIRSSAPLRESAAAGAGQVDQLLFGELFDRIAGGGGFAWGQARRDGYVGFVEESALSIEPQTPTHRVAVLRTFGFETASIKSATVGHLSLNSLVTIVEDNGSLALASDFGWIPAQHLVAIGTYASDPAAVAERFVGAPYLWGGRDSLGLDCSGLIQQSLYACGLTCPRDSDQQATLGGAASETRLARSDLVFWPGHVGMMLDGERLIHANGHHMAVAIEPLAVAVSRIEAAEGQRPIAFRRL